MVKNILIVVIASAAFITGCNHAESSAVETQVNPEVKLLPFKTTKILINLNDSQAKTNPVKRLDVSQLTLGKALDQLGELSDHQDVALDCMGFNAQPPMFDMMFDVAHGKQLAERFEGIALDTSMYNVCMIELDQHLTHIKQYNPDDLKYFTPEAIKTAQKDNDAVISVYGESERS